MSNTYHLNSGSGYGGGPYGIGQVLRNSDHRIAQGEPEYLFVEKAGQRYYREEGMSFGVGDESGYAYWATARPATDEESRPLRQAREQKLRALGLQARMSELVEQIKQSGERPLGPVSPEQEPGAYRMFDTQNIYGGGDWIVISDQSVWFCRNNGHDGDDWSHNNVRTGGAGAIGWRVSHDDSLVRELLDIEAVLDPAAAARRRPGGLARAYQELFAQHLDPVLWPEPVSLDTRSGALAWVSAGPDTPAVIGLARDGTLRVAVPADLPYPSPHGETQGLNRDEVVLHNKRYVAIAYAATPERLAAYEARLPTWATRELARASLQPEPPSAAGPLGCFVLPGFGGRWEFETSAWAALRRSVNCTLDQIQFTSEVELLHAHGKPWDQNPWTLWRSGAGEYVARLGGTTAQPEGPSPVPPAASQVIAIALRQKAWREEGRWRQLLEITTIEERPIDKFERHRASSGDEVHLHELQAQTINGQERVLYRVREDGWEMLEDGDAWTLERLYTDRAQAQVDFEACKQVLSERGPGMAGLAHPPGPGLER